MSFLPGANLSAWPRLYSTQGAAPKGKMYEGLEEGDKTEDKLFSPPPAPTRRSECDLNRKA